MTDQSPDDPVVRRLAILRSRVRAAREEFDLATGFHEAWKPTAYDTALQARMGTSFATHTFVVIRRALRREMLMALVRLWDTGRKAIGMTAIAEALKDGRVVELLAAERRAHWALFVGDLPDVEPDFQDAAMAMFQRMERERGQDEADLLLVQIKEVLSKIAEYQPEGTKYWCFLILKNLRNERLAHREFDANEPSSAPGVNEAIEAFYLDMQNLIVLLIQVAEYTHHELAENGRQHREAAELFWMTVCGERTEGHPRYKPNGERPGN